MTFAPLSAAARKAEQPEKLSPMTSTSHSAVSAMSPSAMGSGAVRQLVAAVLEAVPDDAVPDADEPALCDGEQPARPTGGETGRAEAGPLQEVAAREALGVFHVIPSLGVRRSRCRWFGRLLCFSSSGNRRSPPILEIR